MSSVFILLLGLFILVKPVFAGAPPVQISPEDGATVSSSSLSWQAPDYPLYSTSPYRVQVDDDQSFSSSNKDYYTKNTHYSPVLDPGMWFWRVKAKDDSGSWSDWSNVWSFVLSQTASSSDPNSTPVATPTSSPIPTSTPSLQSSNSFTISNTPSQINSDQSFNVSIDLFLSNSPNSNFYLKGAFKKAGGSNYFGLTKVGDDWVKNGSSFSNQFSITLDSAGNWSGNLEVKPDGEDSGFTGTDEYTFKVGWYSSSGSGPTWSNETVIKILSTNSDQDEVSADTPLPQVHSQPSPSPARKTLSQATSYKKIEDNIASVAGMTVSATPSSSVAITRVQNQRQINPLVWAGLALIFAGFGSVVYIYFIKNGKIQLPFRS